MIHDIEQIFREYTAAIADKEMVEAAEIYANYASNPEFLTLAKFYHSLLETLRDTAPAPE